MSGSGPARDEEAEQMASQSGSKMLGVWRVFLLVCLLLVVLVPAMIARYGHVNGLRKFMITRFFRGLIGLLGIKVRVEGDYQPNIKGCMLASNHCSYLDIFILGALLPARFTPKRDIRSWPVFGFLTDLSAPIFIDRDNRQKMGEEMARIRDVLLSGDVLILFPEGTTNNGREVLRFKSGLFKAADDPEGRIAIQPVTIAYTHLGGQPMQGADYDHVAWYGEMDMLPHLWQVMCGNPIEVTVHFHPVVDRDVHSGRKAISEHCKRTIDQQFQQLLPAGAMLTHVESQEA